MATINVDGKAFEVTEGENLLHACLSRGLDLPYFCWHPAMGSVGACRQCAVVAYQDEDDTRGRLTMACMTPVTDGARISIVAENAEAFRASVIEWLMENHPHDCPVCEEGGECHLQDMTVMTGHTARRYRGQKRTWENQYLGPFINHEMNRCITCYRCVRFYKDYAGGTDLQAFGSRGRMYFGRSEPGVLASEFAGNLVEVCPTGVFTDKPFSATYTRKWDLQSAPSVCTGCSMGCNTIASERYGALKRIHNRYHAQINRYFLCDRGRFGMSYVNSDQRIRVTGERVEAGVFRQLPPADAVTRAAAAITAGSAIGIGSPRASVEDNHALKTLVGDDAFCAGLSGREAAMMARARDMYGDGVPSLHDAEAADAVLVLGEDVMNTAPRLGLAIRQAGRNLSLEMADDAGIPRWQDAGVRGHAQHAGSPLLIASMLPTTLDDAATDTWRATPLDVAAAGVQIAEGLRAGASDAPQDSFVGRAVAELAGAKRPLIVTGVGTGEPELLEAAAGIRDALRGDGRTPGLIVCGMECNSFGAGLLDGGLDVDAALRRVVDGAADTLVVMQNDLYRRAPAALVDAALDKAAAVIVLDSLDNPTAEAAHLLFPAATSVEATGTLVNFEYRAQRFYQVFTPAGDVAPGWRWIAAIAAAQGDNRIAWKTVDDVLADCERQPGWAGVTGAAPLAGYRSRTGQKVPRETHRYSGRTAMSADVTMHEPKTRVDDETPFSYSMEGTIADQPGALTPYVWSPGWNSNQSVFKFQQEVGGPLHGGDPGVQLTPQVTAPAASPAPPAAGDGYRVIPVPVLFGGEELSARSPAVRERMPHPFVVLNETDAGTLGVAAGDGVTCAGRSLEVRIDPAIGVGEAAVPLGLPGAPAGPFGERITLARDADFVRRPTIIARG